MNNLNDLVWLCDGREGIRAMLDTTVREPEAGEGQGEPVLEFISSTRGLDRYEEIIEPAGWKLESYRRNPVFQNAHNYGDVIYTLGKAVATEVRNVGGEQPALFQRIKFAVEVNPIAKIAYGLYRGGFLNAVSVGFIPLRWENGDGKEKGYRRRYLEQELLEVSAVAIPANPEALQLALKAGAVMRSDLKEAAEVLRALGAEEPSAGEETRASLTGLTLARELRRVIRG